MSGTTTSSFYASVNNPGTTIPAANDVPTPTGDSAAPSSFYQGNTVYQTLADSDTLLATITADTNAAAVSAANAAANANSAYTNALSAASSAASAAAAVQAAAGTATPIMDGTAAVGTHTLWAHEDHVHPTDTSRAPASYTTAGSISRTLVSKAGEVVSAADFGAVGDNATDNATALQSFFTYLAGGTVSAPRRGLMPAGVYLTSQPLTLNGSYCSLEPDAKHAVTIRYTGASTTADIITVGNSSTQSARVRIGAIYIDSNTTMTGGAAAHLRNLIQSEIDFSVAGQSRYGAAGNLLYHGVWWDALDNCVWGGREIVAQQDGLRVNGTVGVGAKADLTIREGGKITLCAVGIHCGGGFGGLYINQVNAIGNGTNFLVDTALAAEGNREIFVGAACAFDSSTSTNVVLADTLTNGSAWFAFEGVWIASAAAGVDNVSIATGHNGIVQFIGGTIYNAGRDGIRNNSTTATILVDGTTIRNNAGYGINNAVVNANIIVRNAWYVANVSGATNDPKLVGMFTGANGETFFGTNGQRFAASGLNVPRMNVAGFTDYTGGASFQGWVADARGSSIQMLKSRSAAPGTFAIVQSADEIGRIVFAGDDGTQFGRAAQIRALVDAAPAAGSMAGSLYFDVAASGTVSPIEALRIDNKRNVVVGAAVGGQLATTATTGFFYIPTCAGAPTGVPANTYTGCLPMIYDTTNHKFWIYDTAWKGVVLA
jgi:hypothetical protein